MTVQLSNSDSSPVGWHPSMFDSHLPGYVQRSFDYLGTQYLLKSRSKAQNSYSILAPESVLDEKILPASDMYSLGCLIYSVHNKGEPPYRNRHSVATLRDNVGKKLQGMDRADPDLKGRDSLNRMNDISYNYLTTFSLAGCSARPKPERATKSVLLAFSRIFLLAVYLHLEFFGPVKLCIKVP